MKRKLFNFGLPAALALLIAACGGGGGGIAGVGGSGFVSSGTVTGFGSVLTNGTKFDTDTATFDVDDDLNGSQLNLKVGMVVQVYGTINADGETGTATSITYDNELEGPVSGIHLSLDGNTMTFDIMGIAVEATNGDTEINGTDFTTLTANDLVEISGYYDDTGTLQATYIEYKSSNFDSSTDTVEIKGSIQNLIGSYFTINTIPVDATNASFSDLPNGLSTNAYVEVKGLWNGTLINATEVEAEDNDIGDSNSASIEGYVTRYVSNSDFDINGYTVNAANAMFMPSQLTNRMGLGVKVEAEGSVSNGVMTADYVEIRGGEVKLMATANGVKDAIAGTFEISISGTVITVEVTTATSSEDAKGTGADDLDISTIVNGDKFEVRGFETTTGHVVATKVKRLNEAEVIDTLLQGYVTNQVLGTSITILGVAFTVDDITATGTTDFQDENDAPYVNGHQDLIDASTDNQSIIKIKDKFDTSNNAHDIADEVELETP